MEIKAPYLDVGPIFTKVVNVRQSSNLNRIDHCIPVLFERIDGIVDEDRVRRFYDRKRGIDQREECSHEDICVVRRKQPHCERRSHEICYEEF